jgi:N-acetylmuramoyl-L-alanine amidase
MAWGARLANRVLLALLSTVVLAACGHTLAVELARDPTPEELPEIVAEAAAPPAGATQVAEPEAPPATEPPPPPPPPSPEEQARAAATAAGLDPDARVVVTPTGIVAPVLGIDGDRYVVRTPCANDATVSAAANPIRSATVVLDTGHGGRETGAVGPNGLAETTLNDEVTRIAREALEAAGVDVVQTRYVDHQMTLQTRAEIANALGARAFVSVHHNGGPDGVYDRPGTEMYHQVADGDSRRLAGLLQEELVAFFSQFQGIAWHGNVDAGAKPRPRWDGGDYYGILRRSEVPAVISEGLFLSSSMAEAELLARADVQQGNGEAIARAIWRYLSTEDPGSGFVDPIPRHLGSPNGGGGGTPCDDHPLE